MAASIFGEARVQGPAGLLSIKAGKAELSGTTVTSDARKGLLVVRKSEDGLMHLIWKDRSTNSVEDDLIIFEGDVTIKRATQCKDGFVMLLEFTTGRKLFFWSQEPRKKGLSWDKEEDIAKETELMNKANDVLNGKTPTPAPAPAAQGFAGMSHSELMAMLSGGGAAATAAPAPAPAAAAPAPAAEPAAPAPAAAPEAATPAATPAPAAAATTPAAAPGAAFSAADISSILGNIMPAAAPAPAPSPAAAPGFSADAISNILGNIMATPQAAPVSLNAVLSPEATAPLIDSTMAAALAEHLPAGESAVQTVNTPQLQQAATPAQPAPAAAEPMDTSTDTAPSGDAAEKMEE